jgi:AcrR family transcriptional regulator
MALATKDLEQLPDSPAIKRILDAAEVEFSNRGYDGAGMKAIALRAEVAQGTLHYHFGNKERLYEAVIARRAKTLSAAREARLAQVQLSAPDALEQIFEALYRPNFEEKDGGKAYAMIFNARYVSDDDASHLVNKYYDATAELFIDKMLSVSPGVTRDAAAFAYVLAIGALLMALIRDGRQERLARAKTSGAKTSGAKTSHAKTSDARTRDATERTIRALVLNAAGGFRRLAEAF